MSVVVIGDRKVGKTSMVLALADPGTQNITVVNPEPQSLVSEYSNPDTGEIAGTRRKEEVTLVINVDLPAGQRQIEVQWIDTPGEAWDSKDWRQTNNAAWQDIRKEVSQSQGVLLLLPPHRNMIQSHLLSSNDELDDFPRPDAWANNLTSWLNFFKTDCANVQYILISLHKADLCCNIESEEKKWRYNPLTNISWFEYNQYIRKTYFNKVEKIVRNYNAKHPEISLRFFITTIKNPALLELPWVYLGSYMANTFNVYN